jgi:hypothetical protein
MIMGPAAPLLLLRGFQQSIDCESKSGAQSWLLGAGVAAHAVDDRACAWVLGSIERTLPSRPATDYITIERASR